MDALFALVFALLALWLAIWLFILLPARMAGARGRSAMIWVLVSILISPVVAILLLWVLGDARRRHT